jgi:hypothetical protein
MNKHVSQMTALSAICASLLGCATAEQMASEVAKGVQSTLAGENVVIGTVEVMSPFPGIVTCFKDSPGSAISRRPITHIGQAEGFPALIVTKAGVMSAGSCAELQRQGLLTPVAGGAVAAGATGGTSSLAGTELRGLFERHPQPGAGRTVTWPRVAVTLLEAPPWGITKLNVHRFKYPGPGCWRFKARVWESDKVVRDIPGFQVCTDEPLVFPSRGNTLQYQGWAGIVAPTERPGSTGTTRTEGPNFPDNPLPVSRDAASRVINPATFTGHVLANLVHATGIDVDKPDPRLWINLAPAVEAQGR